MADGFRPGDVVQLKSGGPRMTVTRIKAGRVFVAWVSADGKREYASYEPATLIKPADETKKAERGLGFGRNPL